MPPSKPLPFGRRWRRLRLSGHHGLPTLAEAEDAALHLLHDVTHPRKWWTRGIFWLGLLVGLAVLLSATFQAAMWMAPGYRLKLAREVSIAIGHPITVGKLALSWRWAQPMLEAQGITLYADDAKTPLANAQKIRLGFATLQLLRGEFVPSEVNVAGLALAIDIDAEGHAHLRGLPSNRTPPTLAEVLRQIRRFARIKADDVSISVRDVRVPKGNFAIVLAHGDLRIEATGMELRANVRAPGVLADQLTLRAGLAGNLEAPASLSGQWTLEASNVALGAALVTRLPALGRARFGNAMVKASGDWAHMRLGESTLVFEAASAGIEPESAAGNAAVPTPALLHKLAFTLRYAPVADGGSLQVRNLQMLGSRGAWPTAGAALAWRDAASGREWSGSADFLRLDDLCPWLVLLPPKHGRDPVTPAPTGITSAASAATAAVEHHQEPPQFSTAVGDVQGLEARYALAADGSARYALHARLLGAGIGASTVIEDGSLGVHGINGDVSATEAGGKLGINASNLGLVLPRAFELPAVFETLSGTLSWQHETEGWNLQMPDLGWHAMGTQGRGRMNLLLPPEQAANLDLELRFSAADAARLKPWMPRHWGEGLKHWLNTGIVRARVPAAHLWIKGPMADFPFHKTPSGDWGLDITVADARLEYHPDWPGADKLSAELKFRGNGLEIAADHGIVSGVTATSARGGIADFAGPLLLLDIKTQGEAALYYELLNASPLHSTLRGLLTQTEGEGPAQTDVHLEIPLHAGSGQKLVASGIVRLADNRLRVHALDAPVEGITGSLRFGGPVGVAAEGLSARIYNTPLTADIAPAAGVDTINVRFATRFDESDPLALRYLPAWLRPSLSGNSSWKLTLPLSGTRAGKVMLASSLVGASSRLPPPLAKTAAESLPIHIAIDGDDNTPLRLNLDAEGRLGLALRFARERGELTVHGVNVLLGGGAAGNASEDGVRIVGNADRLNAGDWLGLLSGLHGSGLPFLGAQFSAQHLAAGGYETLPLSVNVSKNGDGLLSIGLSGAGGVGNASLAADNSLLSAEFSRLSLQATPVSATAKAVSDTNGGGGADAIIEPAKLPALNVRIEALNIGNIAFGALNLLTVRDASGQTLTNCTLSGGSAQLKAGGYWRRSKAGAEAGTRFTLSSNDLASTLEGLGFAPTISGKSAVITGDLNWSAVQGGLDWPYARGKIDLAAENGTLSSVDPGGASRVLGLLNLYALPRRLIFDFRDVINKGLGYDRIGGGFDLADGVAQIRNLSIKGPSVKMEITGTVGLAKRDLDQTVTVTPNTGGLTLGAVLLGGATLAVAPAVGVLAVIANQVLDKPIGQATKFSYRLTGPWDNPQIRRGDGTLVNPAMPPAPPSVPVPSEYRIESDALGTPPPASAPLPATESSLPTEPVKP